MNKEVFIVLNVSTGDIEIRDFGIIIPSDVSADLGDFDRSFLSEELDSYLQSGWLVRFINGVSTGYAEAYVSTVETMENPTFPYVDGSLAEIDTSITYLFDNTYTRIYIDGSLDLKADLTYVDGSLAERDTSIQWLTDNTYTRTYIDASLNLRLKEASLGPQFYFQDGSLFVSGDASTIYTGGDNITVDGQSINLDDQLKLIKAIQFDDTITQADVSFGEGVIHWNEDYEGVVIGLNPTAAGDPFEAVLVRDTVVYTYNNTSYDIPAGRAVYVTGQFNSYPTIALTNGTSIFASVFGLSNAEIPSGEYGYVQTTGIVRNLDTTAYNPGDILRLSPEPSGFLSDTTPSAPFPISFVGTVVTQDASVGKILLNINNGPRLSTLPDVNARFSQTDNQILAWDSTNSYWNNFDLSTLGSDVGLALQSNVDASNAIQDGRLLLLESSVNVLWTLPQIYATTTYVDGSLAERDTSITYLFDNTYSRTYLDASFNQIASDLEVTAGLNIDISNGVVSTIEDPSFNSTTIVTDLSLGGDFLFDYENTLTVAKSGAKYTTITDALNDAGSGDVIRVFPGVYTEDVSINKEVKLVGLEGSETKITGTTYVSTTDTVTIVRIQLSNINNPALIIDENTTGLRLSSLRVGATYTSGTGQTADTAKAAIKISNGSLILENVLIATFASGDNTADHNTTGIWVTGSGEILINSYITEFQTFNFLDPAQNLSAIFNNNTNSGTNLQFNAGGVTMQGVASGSNKMYPIYNRSIPDISNVRVENMGFVLTNSTETCFVKDVDSSVQTTSSGNTYLTENIATVNIACSDSSTSYVTLQQDYMSASGPPSFTGDVAYFIGSSDRETYISGNTVFDQTIKFNEYTNPDPSTGELWYQDDKLVFAKSNGDTVPIIQELVNIGEGTDIVSGQDASYNWLLKTVDGSNGLYTYTDGSTLIVDSSIYVPGSFTSLGNERQGPIDYHIPLLYYGTKQLATKTRYSTALLGNTGFTQLAPLSAPDSSQSEWYPWGDITWDETGAGSTIEFSNVNIFFVDDQQTHEINYTVDTSTVSDGAYGLYIDHDGSTFTHELLTDFDRRSYSNKCYIGIIRVVDGSITNFGPSPDIFSTGSKERDESVFRDINFIGFDYTADVSTFSSAAGEYALEGVEYQALDFANNTFTGSQHIKIIDAQSPVEFYDIDPSTGIDETISPYTDYREYANRYWDTSGFVDASDGKFITNAIYKTCKGLNQVRRGGDLYDTIDDAKASLDDFFTNAQPIPAVFEKSFPLVAFVIAQTDVSNLSDTTTAEILSASTTTAGGGGGAGGSGVVGATNTGTGEGIYSSTINQIIQLKTLKSQSSQLLISSNADEVLFDTDIKDYDLSINQLFDATDELDASIVNLYDTKVDLAGDTMTGSLTVPTLTSNGDVSILGTLYVDTSTGDLSGEEKVAAITPAGNIVTTTFPAANIDPRVVNVNTNLNVTDLFGIYYVDTSAGDITLTIPDVSTSNGGYRFSIIKDSGDNLVYVKTDTDALIGDSSLQSIVEDDKGFTLVSSIENDEWIIVQDSRLPIGNSEGAFQIWDLDLRKWISSSNITWDQDNNILNVVDLSISGSIFNANLDASFATERTYVDTTFIPEVSFGSTFTWNSGLLDVSIVPDVTKAYVDGSLATRDSSITYIFNNGLGFLQESSLNTNTFYFDASSLLDISVGKYDTIKFLAGKSTTQALGTNYADVTGWDTATINNSTLLEDYYTWDETTGVLTFGEPGWYEINVQMNTDVLSGATRANTAFKVQEDTGSGYADIPYSETWMYNRTAGQGADNGSFFTIRNYSDGDTLKIQALEDAGDNQITSAQITVIKSEIGKTLTIFDVSGGASIPYVDGSLLARDASISQIFGDYFGNTEGFLYESSLGAGFVFNETTDVYDVSISGAVGLYAWARTTSAGAVVDTYGLSVSRTSTGVYQYTFNSPLTTANYGIIGQPFGTVQDTNCQVANVTTTGFELTFGSGDNGTTPDVPVDAEHSVMVLGPPTEVGLGVSKDYVDGSLAERDADILANSNRLDIVDGSITFLDNYNGIQDASISQNETDISNLESSLNLYVLKAGDTMTGKLTTTALDVTGDVSLSQKVHLTEYDNTTPEFGDLWVDPSGCINFAYEVSSICASSYNLQNRLLRTEDDWGNFPDSSTLDAGDRILIEDAQDGFKKKYISADAFSTSITGGFGEYPAYADSIAISSTTSTTYQNKLTLTTDASAIATDYRIGFTLQLSNSNNSKSSWYRVQIDGNTIEEAEIDFSDGGTYFSYSGFEHRTLTAGSHTITIDYRRGNGGTASIRDVRVEFWRTGTDT